MQPRLMLIWKNARATRFRRKTVRTRRGNAAVELAITLPVMVTIVFGSVEICQLIYAKQAIESAAYECARVAVDSEASDSAVRARMTEILDQRGVHSGSITTEPSSIEKVPLGTRISVQVSAPFAENTWLPVRFVSQANIEAQYVMLKEL